MEMMIVESAIVHVYPGEQKIQDYEIGKGCC